MSNPLHNSLKRLIEEGGKQNFLILDFGDYYIQIAGEYYSSYLLLEAVSNHYLSTDKKLDSVLQRKILDLGWEAPKGEGNYNLKLSINSNNEYDSCVEFIEKTAKEIYDVDTITNSMIELNLE
ncbi:hypothetical protein WAF17_15575 [Bernardetia sp. ABR2-2B]|uniref:TY-Chap domain-containing protein n=1 Tax=Bernardetia sp. ABR2-2B TaxID=3127472 RepID=UPI0030D1AA28